MDRKKGFEARGWNGVEQIQTTGDQVAGLCEQGKETLGSIKCLEFFSLAEKPLPDRESSCSMELPTWTNISCALLWQLKCRLLFSVKSSHVTSAFTPQ